VVGSLLSKDTTMTVSQDIPQDDSNTKVWLITGTSSGMGRALVRSALERNDKVIATARVLEQIQDLCSLADASRLYLMQLDITDSQDVINSRVVEAIAVWGRIDVLVNNAGTGVKMILEEGGYVSRRPPGCPAMTPVLFQR
jgi:NADP-dependent 3-hydroxy acid dehydrogenase YdfG